MSEILLHPHEIIVAQKQTAMIAQAGDRRSLRFISDKSEPRYIHWFEGGGDAAQAAAIAYGCENEQDIIDVFEAI